MSALTTREAARERLLKIAETVVDRLIPADQKRPLRGQIFADFENQTYAAGNDLLTAMMEERAKLEENARVEGGGRCPFCGSQRTYLEKETTKKERLSPSGPVIIEEQNARCRACDGSFSPSGERLGATQRGTPDAQGSYSCRARKRAANLRPCRRGVK